MDRQFAGKHVLVTGGSRGIGLAIAAEFASQGASVWATGLERDDVSQASQLHPHLQLACLDVTDQAAIEAFVHRFEQLDVLVNCAGMIARDGAEHTVTGFEQVVDVNLTGTMRTCIACKPLLTACDGCVVNTASMLTFFGSGHAPAYSSSKGGIGQLTKSLAIAWAAEGIRVNAIAPGWIRTELTRPLYEDESRSRPILDRTPLGRWGEPEDIAGAVLFLCSQAARFITGTIVPIDGGYSIS